MQVPIRGHQSIVHLLRQGTAHTFWTTVSAASRRRSPAAGGGGGGGGVQPQAATGSSLCSPCTCITCMHLLTCLAVFDLQGAHVKVKPASIWASHAALQQ